MCLVLKAGTEDEVTRSSGKEFHLLVLLLTIKSGRSLCFDERVVFGMVWMFPEGRSFGKG